MIITEIALRYAKALYRLAANQAEKEIFFRDLTRVLVALNHVPKAMCFFLSPQIDQSQKKKILEKCFGKDMDPKALAFLFLLLEKIRFNYFPQIVKEFSRMLDKELGRVESRLITAEPMSKGDIEQLKGKLEKVYRKKFVIQEEVDKRLIGGGILVIGNKLVDFSLRKQLQRLKEDLLAVSVHTRSDNGI